MQGSCKAHAVLMQQATYQGAGPACLWRKQFVCQGRRGVLPCSIEPMHELAIMQSALSLALDQAQQAGAVRVHSIRLRIGALSGVVPDALSFAFEALTPGTLAEGAQLAIEPVPARFWCARCTREFQSDDLFGECPDCHNCSGELRAGREMELASLEID
jgi:hydrogenase nickel incorporation protein HypA/HybF